MIKSVEKQELIIKTFQQLSLEKQQQVIDFAEKLAENQEAQKSPSAYDVAKEFAGCVDFGPGDLATNKSHLSLADACLVRMSELIESSCVLTFDSDFRVYRRHKNEAIELIIPDNF